jgi:hypothetical protein
MPTPSSRIISNSLIYTPLGYKNGLQILQPTGRRLSRGHRRRQRVQYNRNHPLGWFLYLDKIGVAVV